MDHPLADLAGRDLKLFIVEAEDTDRERVVECRVNNLSIRVDHDYSDVLTDYSNYPVARYMTSQNYYIEEMQLIPLDSEGHVMRVRNFAAEESEEE